MAKQIELNRYNFFMDEHGSGEKLVLVHGSASDHRTWVNNITELSREFNVISYSRRYHWPNEQIKEGEDYSMLQHVNDLKSLIKRISNKPVHLVGHSYGALMCLELACQTPELINKMVLCEPPAITLFVSNTPKPKELLRLLFSRPRTALSIIKLGATGLGPATKAAKKGDMKQAMQLFGEAALGKQAFSKMPEERKEQAFINLTSSELTGSGFLPLPDNQLKNLTIPTLLLTGEKSPKVFLYLKNRLEELIPGSIHKKISKASHIIHEDNVEAFNTAVLSFLLRGR